MSLRSLLTLARRKLSPEGDLTSKTVTSGIWSGLFNVTDRGLQMIKLVAVTSLLSPEAFGIFGIALLALSILTQFSQLGINQALIQREEDDIDEFLNTAWVMDIVRGVAIAAVGYVGSPVVAAFFGEPAATPFVRVLALIPLLGALRNPGVVYLQKDLRFDKEFGYRLSGTLIDVSSALIIAYLYQTVWALVVGQLLGELVRSVISYWIHDYRPAIEFDVDYARELFGFGKWVMGSTMVVFLLNEGDDAFVGWFLGASALGAYQLAYRLSNAPATEVTSVISRVVFPAYSKLQNDTDALRGGFIQTFQVVTAISFPVAVGIALVAPSFITVVLGEQWTSMIVAMQILAGWGLIRSMGASFGPLFQAVGRPDLSTKIQLFKLALIVPAIYPATELWGIAGTATVIVGNAVVAFPIALYVATKILNARFMTFIKVMGYPAFGTTTMAASVLGLQSVLPGQTVISLVGSILLGAGVYIGTMVALEFHFEFGLRDLVGEIRDATL